MQVLYYTEKTPMKRVYYTGSDALLVGYALCYDRDNITAAAKGAGPHLGSPDLAEGAALTAGYENYARHAYVEKPAAGNLKWFAGVVASLPESGATPGTGPGWIDIIEPAAIGRGVLLYTDLSCTINATPLHVQAASYAFGSAAAGGPKVAMAMQTINRGTTNGLVQAVMTAPIASTADQFDAKSRAVTALPTAAIWNNFPLDDMRRNPWLGSLWETDFTRGIGFPGEIFVDSTYAAAAGGKTLTEGIYPGPLAIGEMVLFTTTDNQACEVIVPCPITVSGGTEWAMEFRIKNLLVDDSLGNVFGGLLLPQIMSGDLITDLGALIDGGALGFQQKEADGNVFDFIYDESGQAQNEHDADYVTIVADTYNTLGMYYNGTDIQGYLDGVALGTAILGTGDIDQADFPTAAVLVPAFLIKSGNAADLSTTIDWARVAQAPA